MKASQLTPQNERLDESELALGKDGSVYHLALHPGEVAPTVLLVGDPGRVKTIASFFTRVEYTRQHREFVTTTGTYNGKRITALATGIGTDNIDIVINELDALLNIDLENRTVKPVLQRLNLVRIGTCGTIRPEIDPGQIVVSRYALGFDPVAHFYEMTPEADEKELMRLIQSLDNWPEGVPYPYAAKASEAMFDKIKSLGKPGITLTAPGFYGPQGRTLRLPSKISRLNNTLLPVQFKTYPIVNWEMETSSLFSLAGALNHLPATICLVVANRSQHSFLPDYKAPMKGLIEDVLNALTT